MPSERNARANERMNHILAEMSRHWHGSSNTQTSFSLGGNRSTKMSGNRCEPASVCSKSVVRSQGQRTLTTFSSKDMYQGIVIPTTSSSVHSDAFFVRVLFKQRKSEAIEPGEIFAEMLVTDA